MLLYWWRPALQREERGAAWDIVIGTKKGGMEATPFALKEGVLSSKNNEILLVSQVAM